MERRNIFIFSFKNDSININPSRHERQASRPAVMKIRVISSFTVSTSVGRTPPLPVRTARPGVLLEKGVGMRRNDV